MSEPVLKISDLATTFRTSMGEVRAVDGVNLTVERGRTLGIVGESGCGKSMLSLSVMGLVPAPGKISRGEIRFEGQNLAGLSPSAMRDIRGNEIAMIFQEPMTSLNPVHTVGFQIVEAIRAHERMSQKAARALALDALKKVRIPSPERRLDEYPHQLSGGMRQRVMIAMALACRPTLLIADEPTTALDVTIQAQILNLLRDLQAETGMSIVLITHDLGVVAEVADDVAVMYAGKVVERGSVTDIFDDPQHPYTLGLMGSMPRMDEETSRLVAIEGMVPPPFRLPPGCRFNPRCPFADDRCRSEQPPLAVVEGAHLAACLKAPLELNA
ncbi:ABC transporter ATP-binding protein [Aureimonas mangrovi]|uniref:ABC transporter ATP-binding protein n=1 Tax=Aureimonas mangrovi TaxID=2758041 RepID=UPI00163D54A3|nr:ABC transporter ATP-binding protein [Aureimonas mangrovi]